MATGLPVRGFREECELLAPLESIDPTAFRGTPEVPQELCDFVLAIALMYNDCKDVVYAHVALTELKPKDPNATTRFRGAFSGVQLHAFRAVASLVHELFTLISKNKELLRDHSFFGSVVQQLPPNSRAAWDALVSVADGATPTDPFGRALLLLRNKVGFHFDAKAISQGYRKHFVDIKRDDRAYLSRGDSMRATRFYFADAAAIGYLRLVAPGEIDELMHTIAGIMDQLNRGLMMLVIAFIQRRAYPFRLEVEA